MTWRLLYADPMGGQLSVCASCGASNPAEARWCGQCYAGLDPVPDGVGRPEGWTCRICREVNQPTAATCSTCGSSIYESFGEREEIVLPGEAVRSSAVPGMGLVRVGLRVEGILTFVLVAFALVAGLFIISAGGGGGWVLVIAAAVLWLVAVRDAYMVATKTDTHWLEPRTISVAAGLIIIMAAILILRTPLS